MGTKDLGSWAKKRLEDIAVEMEKRLVLFWDCQIDEGFGFGSDQKKLVRDMLLHGKEHNLRSAKRLRASLVCYGYLLVSGGDRIPEEVWQAAESVEIVHTALLMHDDFMDMDKIRRGGKTTQEYFANGDGHYGESMAVCLGDAILCLGFERLLGCGGKPAFVASALKQLMRGVSETAFGQGFDVSLSRLGEMTEQKVLDLHRAKTAIYTYENPLLIGTLLGGGLPMKVYRLLKEYSADGGVAFQLQDDILGIFGDEKRTGKSADSDLLQGKVTMLVIKTLEFGSKEQKSDLMKVWGKVAADKNEIEMAKRAILESGSFTYSVSMAKNLAEKAITHINKLRGQGLGDEAIDFLEGIAHYMVERKV